MFGFDNDPSLLVPSFGLVWPNRCCFRADSSVKAVKMAILLQSVHSIVSTIKIQNQLARNRLEAVNELFEEHLVHQPGFFAASSIL
jgi:hypothetical protein